MSSASPPDRELARLRRVLKLESAGTWEWDLRTQEMTWDRGHRLLFGVSDAARITPEAFLWMLHGDDRAHVEAVFQEALRSRHEYTVEYRITRPIDGQLRWIEARGRIEFDGDTPVRAAGIVLDATERREQQRSWTCSGNRASITRSSSRCSSTAIPCRSSSSTGSRFVFSK